MSANVIDRILEDSGEGGLSGALSRCGVPMTFVEVDDAGILHDADTPEDYRELLRMHNSQLTRPMVQVSICREKRFLDPRVAMLLTLTDETQSVRAACQRMQLSYSSGWNAINLLETELGYPVVARSQGGQHGGRSSLTEKGRALLRAYEAYTLRLRAMADELFVQYFPDLFK
jgi:molybdate transport repressor ModE-like protein